MSEWFERPIRRSTRALLVVAALCLPAVWMRDAIGWNAWDAPRLFLFGDDFYYFGASRTLPRTLDNLWTPHNSHIVPVFRLWNWAVFAAGGRWEHLPVMAALASYGTLAMTIAVLYALLRSATGNYVAALGAALALGLSIVTQPAVTWYSASQTLVAGLGILCNLWALDHWARSGGWRMLMLAMIAACLSIGSWSGGVVVAPVAASYLWTVGGTRGRRAAAISVVVLCAVIAGRLALPGDAAIGASNLGGRTPSEAIRVHTGMLHTVAGVAEFLMFRNVGLETHLTPMHAVVFCLLLMLGWFAANRWTWRIVPLEAAGVTLVVSGFLLPYSVRGYLPFDSLRELRWYCVLPQIGLLMFLGGWYARLYESNAAPRRRDVAWLVVFAVAFASLHWPASRQMYARGAPPLEPSERELFPTESLQFLRARYFGTERRASQARFLRRLDRIETTAQRLGANSRVLAESFGPIRGPGVLDGTPVFDLLDLPAQSRGSSRNDILSQFSSIVADEPEPRPPWLPSPRDESGRF